MGWFRRQFLWPRFWPCSGFITIPRMLRRPALYRSISSGWYGHHWRCFFLPMMLKQGLNFCLSMGISVGLNALWGLLLVGSVESLWREAMTFWRSGSLPRPAPGTTPRIHYSPNQHPQKPHQKEPHSSGGGEPWGKRLFGGFLKKVDRCPACHNRFLMVWGVSRSSEQI